MERRMTKRLAARRVGVQCMGRMSVEKGRRGDSFWRQGLALWWEAESAVDETSRAEKVRTLTMTSNLPKSSEDMAQMALSPSAIEANALGRWSATCNMR